MAEILRFLPAGSNAFLVEVDSPGAAQALFDGLLADRPDSIVEIVPAARTVMIRFCPVITDRSALIDFISGIDLSVRPVRDGDLFEIPVVYDGQDLSLVADELGISVKEVIRRHTGATYTVAFTGFAPGFAYMTCDDPVLDVSRHKSPRLRIPAGSVGLAGRFSGVYPSDSPGGWKLVGTTPLEMWDPGRTRPALLAPGDRVRFMDIAKGASVPVAAVPEKVTRPAAPSGGLLVTRADFPALYQDFGRPGHAGQGVVASGALDRTSLIEANLCVGNPRNSPVIEITYGGFALRADRPVTLAVTGARAPLTIHTGDGRRYAAPFGRPFALDPGDGLSFDYPPQGTRSYLALRGGFVVETVLGSAATDTLGKVGPPQIQAGDYLVPANKPVSFVDPFRPRPASLPKATDTVTLDVVPGPRADWFTSEAMERLLTQKWQVSAETSRVGMRLTGPEPLTRRDKSELLSEGTSPGAIQVPPSGQPVLFLADHPLTGGYPVIAVVAAYHLDLAGQVPVGANICFNANVPFDPLIRKASR